MSAPVRPSKNAQWLSNARADLDTNADTWVVPPSQLAGTSKAQAIGHYLDVLLKDLGYPGPADRPHPCSVCQKTHDPDGASSEPASVADLIEADAEEWAKAGERARLDIEDMERRLVQRREDRDRSFRLTAEARTAANILRDVGLRSSIERGQVRIDLDYTPQRPEGGVSS